MKHASLFFCLAVACAAPQPASTNVTDAPAVLARARAVPGVARLLDLAVEDARLPKSARDALRLEGAGGSVDVRALDVADVPAAVVSRAAVYPAARPGLDVLLRASRFDVEELRVVYEPLQGPVGRYSLTLHGSFVDALVVDGHLEIRDRDGVSWRT